MRPYFETTTPFGRQFNEGQLKGSEENITQIKDVEEEARRCPESETFRLC
jgi:hypothetical protein